MRNHHGWILIDNCQVRPNYNGQSPTVLPYNGNLQGVQFASTIVQCIMGMIAHIRKKIELRKL